MSITGLWLFVALSWEARPGRAHFYWASGTLPIFEWPCMSITGLWLFAALSWEARPGRAHFYWASGTLPIFEWPCMSITGLWLFAALFMTGAWLLLNTIYVLHLLGSCRMRMPRLPHRRATVSPPATRAATCGRGRGCSLSRPRRPHLRVDATTVDADTSQSPPMMSSELFIVDLHICWSGPPLARSLFNHACINNCFL